MRHPILARAIALAVAIFLALGPGVSAVQASRVASDMATVAGDMQGGGPSGCNGCGDRGDPSGLNVAGCFSFCTAISPAVVPVAAVVRNASRAHWPSWEYTAATERISAPDPHPPKSLDRI